MASEKDESGTKPYLNSPDRDILTTEGCQKLLNCGDKALSALINHEEKGVPPFPAVPVGNSYRFARSEVLLWMAKEGPRLLAQKPG